MILLKHPIVTILFVLSLSILSYQVLTILQQLIHRYRASYIDSVSVSLKDLFLLFDPKDVLKTSLILGIFLALITYIFIGNILISILLAAIGFFVPKIYLSHVKKKRLETFGIQLIDGLSLISNALRAGQSLPQAFSLLVAEMPPPISQEFGILVKEYELGVPINTCLENISKRVKSKELELFVNSILVCGQTGGNLTETFDNIAMIIRERIRLEGKIDSMTSEGRSQGMVLTLMPLALGLAFYWIQPELMGALFTTIPGRVILLLIIVLDALAWYLTKKIIDIDI